MVLLVEERFVIMEALVGRFLLFCDVLEFQQSNISRLDSLMNPHCSCVSPYYGDRCQFFPKCNQKSCKNGYCLNNSTCACRIGFEGGFCETQIEVKTPAFKGRSFLIVEKLSDKKRNIRDSPTQIRQLFLNFTTTETEGLLLWTRKVL